ncbi:hypothetical protein C7999DRAFT_16053 [Corynascus novoguineensis]|uniref:CCHC-type domain-containing protein n=1 Tax=Corynascus novoguineensis TaxID=1126955 RepID=A0AAN7CS00_9PEZI|nr:hypothetical protein C7999DRAFT_16053 [Corynascus novoguineensis]
MSRATRVKQNFEVLGIDSLDSLDSLSLAQFADALRKVLPSDKSNDRVLEFFVIWLCHRLMAVDLSIECSLSSEIATWYRFVKEMPVDDSHILAAFHDWQRCQAVENPASSRRLSIAESELRKLIMPASSKLSDSDTSSAKSEDRFGQMHPDRAKLPQQANIVIKLGDDNDGDDVIIISSNTLRRSNTSLRGKDGDRQPDTSFLTGPNMLPMNDRAKPSRIKGDLDVSELESKGKPMQGATVAHSEGGSSKPPVDCSCNRCGQKGHYFEDCPTNIDPTFDRKPPKAYVCHLCNRKGHHHTSLCPTNRDSDSITQQRLKHAKNLGLSSKARLFENQDCPRNELWLPDRGSSPSPSSNISRRRCKDTYRPLDGLARLHLARHQPRKRRASRSPSPGQIASRKKNHLCGNEGLKDGPKMELDDDLVSHQRGPEEGRLSYDDEDDGSIARTSSIKLTSSPASDKGGAADASTTIAFEDTWDDAHAKRKKQWELAVLDMIRTESIKTDLLVLVNGIEYSPFFYSQSERFFLSEENLWVNQSFNKRRPSSAEFYNIRNETEQQTEEPEYEMVTEGASEGVLQCSSPEDAANPGVTTLEFTNLSPEMEEDVPMVDSETTAAMAVPTNAANLPTIAAAAPNTENLCRLGRQERASSQSHRVTHMFPQSKKKTSKRKHRLS